MQRNIAPPGASPLSRALHAIGLPAVAAERCVHAGGAGASCRACVDACPTGAWRAGVTGAPCLDARGCDGCGLCAPACPAGAIAHAHTPARRIVAGRVVAFAACAQTGLRNGARDGEHAVEGVLPCLNALGLSDLLRLYRGGVRRLVIARDRCAACPTGGGTAVRLDAAVAELNLLLDSRGLSPLVLSRRSPVPWRAQLAFDSLPAEDGEAVEDGFVPPARRLPEPAEGWAEGWAGAAVLWPWVPSIDAGACPGCGACAAVCPTGAIRLREDPPAFLVAPEDCTGCRLCVDHCGPLGVILERLAPRRQTVVPILAGGQSPA
ncbi:4Fe-4S binding protein [Azospirillum sp.]|uniref:4Fe-4S binding protein n=1 Tax=Azospirillum sp. TaxID=34012 RepID=UPI002D73AEBE|nr:4Fe-4S binding protein [Azospirillum sp.]HYD67688.1 4Fe-4S binding protein [Azospirillum sp.]